MAVSVVLANLAESFINGQNISLVLRFSIVTSTK